MDRYSKPLGNLFSFKQEFFEENDKKLREFELHAKLYRQQPTREKCKNCHEGITFDDELNFQKFGVVYALCSHCGHLNGNHEDTDEFCSAIYGGGEGDGEDYASTYLSSDAEIYDNRVDEIYAPKAQFLFDSLVAEGIEPDSLIDFGAGAGYFIAGAKKCGFSNVIGHEVSKTLVNFGNTILGKECIFRHDLPEICNIIENAKADVVSMIFVLEHLQHPRDVLRAIKINKNIRYFYFSVPLFSPSVLFESVFQDVMPRHLTSGHTHLYTKKSIDYLCEEFGFRPVSKWWFGLDMADMYRSICVSLGKANGENKLLRDYLDCNFLPLIDKLQNVLDEEGACTEVHILVEKIPCEIDISTER